MTGERTTETSSFHPWGGQDALPMMEQVQPNPCMKAIWLSSPLEPLDSRVDLWETSTSKAGAARPQAEGVRERLRSFCLHWSSQTLTVKKKKRAGNGFREKKKRCLTLKYEFPGMNFLSFQFTSLGSCDTSPLFSSLQPVSWLTEEEWTHTLLPTLPGFHPVPPRHAPCVILLRPLLLPAWQQLSGC